MLDAVAEFECFLARITTSLAREDPITYRSVQAKIQERPSSRLTEKQVLKSILRLTTDYRARNQLGRTRAALLLGAALQGTGFITAAERASVLLCDETPSAKFRAFLAHLDREAGGSDNEYWQLLRSRLQTYLAYERLATATSAHEGLASRLLRTSPREAIKKVLTLTHLRFLIYMDFKLPPGLGEWLDEFGTPEQLASISSLLVALANGHRHIESIDFAFPLGADIANAEMRSLMEFGKALQQRYEVAKDISLFGYKLEVLERAKNREVFYLRPPSLEFEYSLRLGFVRSEIGLSSGLLEPRTSIPGQPMSILGAAKMFAERLRDKICELKDEDTQMSRIALKFPAGPELYKTVLEGSFYEDFLDRDRLSQDFLVPLRRGSDQKVQLTDKLDLATFIKIWRLLQFLCLVDMCAVQSFGNINSATLFNSILRVSKEEDLINLIASIGIAEEQAREFLRLVSADAKRLGYLDLQYRPFLRIAPSTLGDFTSPPEIIHIPALVGFANVLRNVQSANQLRLTENAKFFVEAVAELLGSSFQRVTTNRRVKSKIENTDIDVIVLEGKTLYLFECKHSLPPTSSHEMRDIWEDIEKGAAQLRVAMRLLANPSQLLNYLTGWFPGISRNDATDIRIEPCLICSHRIFAGARHGGIPVRDLSSIAKLTQDGIVRMGIIRNYESVLQRFRLTRKEGFEVEDLDDYLSDDSTYFKMFRAFMNPVSKLVRCEGLTIARETYVYEMDNTEWATRMTSLGFARLEDETRKLVHPWTAKDLGRTNETTSSAH